LVADERRRNCTVATISEAMKAARNSAATPRALAVSPTDAECTQIMMQRHRAPEAHDWILGEKSAEHEPRGEQDCGTAARSRWNTARHFPDSATKTQR
jgi:hypothetical protein